MRVALSSVEAVYRPSDALLPERGQMFAVQVEVDQSEAGAHPMMVFRDPPIAHLDEAEDALPDAEHVFYLRSNLRLSRVLRVTRLWPWSERCARHRLSASAFHREAQHQRGRWT